MAESIADRVRRWDLSGATTTTGELFNQVHERVSFLQKLHYDQYLPILGTDHFTDFETRLEKWLDNVTLEEDRKILLELVPHIAFFGRDEFTKMYQSALAGPITRWIINLLGVNFVDVDLQDKLVKEIHENTWFCAVSDSMQISDFCHANHLGGINYRPDFRNLSKFGDINRILDFMSNRVDTAGRAVPLRQIVLLEDFIGSGAQLEDANPLISQLLDKSIPILLVPLIICPDGANRIASLFASNSLFRLDPVLQISPDFLICMDSDVATGSLAEKVKELAQRTYPQVVGNNAANPRPYSPFGFPTGRGTGSLVVLYSNTPANTLPIIQHKSNTWKPLFPRSARVK